MEKIGARVSQLFLFEDEFTLSDKLAVGAAWPDSTTEGIVDAQSPHRCSLRQDVRRLAAYLPSLLPDSNPCVLMIVTWNDYEEGTAIECRHPHC